jgi:hypothetical protein
MSNLGEQLYDACGSGDLPAVNRLLADSAVDPSVAFRNWTSLGRASHAGHLAVVERLLHDARVDPSAEDNQAIRWASWADHLAVVERLLQDERVDPSAADNEAIRWASLHGHSAVVDRLLQDERVDPAAGDNYAIRQAALHGHVRVVDRLLQDARVDPSADDNHVLRLAARNGHSGTLHDLLQHPRVDATGLHTSEFKKVEVTMAAAADELSLAAVQRMSATLTLPFPADSRILAWQPRIRTYHEAAVALAGELTANWRLDGADAGVSEEVMDDLVWMYCFGLRLPQYRALNLTPPQKWWQKKWRLFKT